MTAHLCTYLGPEYDPRRLGPKPQCYHTALQGKHYCEHHYPVVYAEGTALRKRRKDAARRETLEDLLQMMRDVADEVEAEIEAGVLDEDEEVEA